MKPGFLLRPDSGLMCFTPQSSPGSPQRFPGAATAPQPLLSHCPVLCLCYFLLVFCAGFSILLRSKSYSS